MTDSLSGEVLDLFIQKAILQNTDIFTLNQKEGLIQKLFNDGSSEPSDMATYAWHHVERLKKTNSIDDSVKLVFNDLTPDEIATSFLTHTSPEARDQLLREI